MPDTAPGQRQDLTGRMAIASVAGYPPAGYAAAQNTCGSREVIVQSGTANSAAEKQDMQALGRTPKEARTYCTAGMPRHNHLRHTVRRLWERWPVHKGGLIVVPKGVVAPLSCTPGPSSNNDWMSREKVAGR